MDLEPSHRIAWGEAVRAFGAVAARSFGGPAGQIAVMHRILVEERRWIGEQRFLHALNYCMLLPGPEAQQLATYLGWLLFGVRGGLMAGWLFVLPGFLSILGLSLVYSVSAETAVVEGLLFGVKAAVLAVAVEAVVRIGRRVLLNAAMRAVAVAAFVALFAFAVPFPLVVLAAGLLGLAGERFAPALFVVLRGRDAAPDADPPALDALLDRAVAAPPSARATLRTAAIGLALWLGPILALRLVLGPEHVLVAVGVFFSKVATVTFGGAYAALAYVAQEAVVAHGWLRPGEMLDGLGLAEATPGPLVQVVQFVGFLAAARAETSWPPLLLGTLGAIVTTWATFAPCFLWIFVGAPYIEWLRGSRRLTAALSTITAAVVGVILNLSVWLALHVVFTEGAPWDGPLGLRVHVPVLPSLDPLALAIAAGAMVAMLRLHAPMLGTLGVAALVGLAGRLLLGVG